MTRLHDIVSLVPQDARSAADVGYDHGKVIALLARTHEQLRIIGVEQQAEARERFWRRHGADESLRSRVELLHGDGLEPLRDKGVDVVVIAGLGERRIVDMLTESEGILSGIERLVFSPITTKGVLRRFLRSISWSVVEERLTRKKGRFYQVYAAEPGIRSIDEATWLFGTDLFNQNHPLLLEFLTDLRSKYEPLLRYYGDDRGGTPAFYRSITRAIGAGARVRSGR